MPGKRKLLALVLLCLLVPASYGASSTSSSTTSYDDINFPQWSRDLRRTEIITFGSLPFVTIWATVAYSAYEYGEFRNPLNKSSDGLSTSDQKHIMQIAAISCIGLGLTDLAYTLIRRSVTKHRRLRKMRPDAIVISPVSREEEQQAPEGSPLRDPRQKPRADIPQDYLQGGIESAVF